MKIRDVIPWAIGDLNRVFAAYSGSTWIGLVSPTIFPKFMMSSEVILHL